MQNGPHTNGYNGHPNAHAVVAHGKQDETFYAPSTPVNYDGYGADPEDNLFDFWKGLEILLRRKWLILSIVLAGLTAAAVMTLNVTPLYKAKTTIEVQREEARILSSEAVDPGYVADAEHMETQYQLLKSRSLAERVADVLDLTSDPRYADPELTREQRLKQAAQTIVENTRVTPQGRSRVIGLQFISPHKEETARIANALVDNFIESNLERKYNTTAYARRFIEERLAQAKTALELSERELVEYAEDQNILELDVETGGGSLDTTSLVTLNAELAQAESARILAEQKYREAANSVGARDIIDNPQLQRLKESRANLNSQYQEDLETFKPGYPSMEKLKAKIDAIDADIRREENNILSANQQELAAAFRAAQAREKSLRDRVRELKSSVQSERNRKIEYTILQREVDTNRSQYEALLQRMKEVSIATGVGSSQVSIIDEAVVPTLPFQPNIIRSMLQALILSLVAGGVIAVLLNYVDDTIKSPDDVRSKLGLPTLGIIPKVKSRSDMIVSEMEDPKSLISEAFFSTRTALEFSTESGTPKSLLFTSTRPGEGKTNCTLALGMSFARLGKNVLIIDADLRKPSFVTDARASIGLSGLLARNASLSDNVISSQTSGLHLLPAGAVPPNPAELLSSSKLPALLAEAESMFDLVLIDSPPVLSFTDSPILGSVAKGTIVIIQAGAMRTPAIVRMVGRMQEANSSIIGAILTKFDASRHAAYDYYSYGFDYGEKEMSRAANEQRKITLFADEAGDSESQTARAP